MTLSVNGREVAVAPETTGELAAARELLRQRAVAVGLLPDGDGDDAAIDTALEALLAREVTTPLPGEDECRRYYDAHKQEFHSGALVHARHILFQVTPGVSIPDIRARAEQTLRTLLQEPERFAALAAELSNCPSGQHGGNLGQLGRGDTVPEFERALFRPGPTGLLREVVKTRFGFHIIAVDQRIAGAKLPFEAVQARIAEHLRTGVEERALRQYVRILAGQADIRGADLDASESPLLQ